MVENYTYEELRTAQWERSHDEQAVNVTRRDSFGVNTILVVFGFFYRWTEQKKEEYIALQEQFEVVFDFRRMSDETNQQFPSNLTEAVDCRLEKSFRRNTFCSAGTSS
jgi:hypothetical protein